MLISAAVPNRERNEYVNASSGGSRTVESQLCTEADETNVYVTTGFHHRSKYERTRHDLFQPE
jgi:hypothetical protein